MDVGSLSGDNTYVAENVATESFEAKFVESLLMGQPVSVPLGIFSSKALKALVEATNRGPPLSHFDLCFSETLLSVAP